MIPGLRRGLMMAQKKKEVDTYYIYTASDLLAARDAMNSALDTTSEETIYNTSKSIKLMADIVFNEDWQSAPAWMYEAPSNAFGAPIKYVKNFDGNGHTIYGLYASQDDYSGYSNTNYGILGHVIVELKNLRLKGCTTVAINNLNFFGLGAPLKYTIDQGIETSYHDCCVDYCFQCNTGYVSAAGSLLIKHLHNNCKFFNNYRIYGNIKGSTYQGWHSGIAAYTHDYDATYRNARDVDTCYNACHLEGNIAGLIGSVRSGGTIDHCYWDYDSIRTTGQYCWSDGTFTVNNSTYKNDIDIRTESFKNILQDNKPSSGKDWAFTTNKYPFINGWSDQGIAGKKFLVFSGTNAYVGKCQSSRQPLPATSCSPSSTDWIRKIIWSNLLGCYLGVNSTTSNSLFKSENDDAYVWKTYTPATIGAATEDLNEAGGMLVISGNSGKIETYDGTTWEARTSNTTNNLFMSDFGNGFYFVGGAYGTLLRSSDAVTWTAKTTGTSGEIQAYAYSPTLNIHVFGAGTTGVFGWSDDDGDSWTTTDQGLSSVYPVTIIWVSALGKFFAAATGGYIFASSDGKSWSSVYHKSSSTNLYGIAFDPNTGMLIAVGYSGLIVTSSDGATWTERSFDTSIDFRDIIYVDRS